MVMSALRINFAYTKRVVKMDLPRAHHILPTNATSAANPLASTTPTAVARDTVIQTNLPGEPPEYREIKTTEKVLHPTPLEYAPPPDISTETKTTIEEASKVPATGTKTTTTTVVEEVPQVVTPAVTVVKNAPVSTEYVVTSGAAFRPVEVVTTTTPAESSTKKVTKTTETVETTK